MKDKACLELIQKLVDKPAPKKENWFKELKNYSADDRVLKDQERIQKS
ncbi:MAG: hypothetical protein LBM13_03870 [Candidatus Ancillula sp.]|jgi:hypothetical protein|nr:hypothetical protein [Candidatus Ancillula sp.]